MIRTLIAPPKEKKNNTLESPIEQSAEQRPKRRVIQFRDKFDESRDCGTLHLCVTSLSCRVLKEAD